MSRSRRRARSAWVLTALLALAAGCSNQPTGQGSSPSASSPFGAGTLMLADGSHGLTLTVEVADTEQARQQGLMGRNRLPGNAGMVFLFEQPTATSFWMKDTLIPLTIAFWDGTGRLVAVLDMTPCRTDSCPLYNPGRPYLAAVEVAQGVLRAHGIGVGARVRFERSRRS